jgi:hypothetical protein
VQYADLIWPVFGYVDGAMPSIADCAGSVPKLPTALTQRLCYESLSLRLTATWTYLASNVKDDNRLQTYVVNSFNLALPASLSPNTATIAVSPLPLS